MRVWTFALLVSLAAGLCNEKPARAADAGLASAIPCDPPPAGDSRPWEYRGHVLSLFPRAEPPPKFIGAFMGSLPDSEYELHVWQDSKGVFGELLHPVLDQDSPTSRLLDAQFDPKSGALSFGARFEKDNEAYVGRLQRSTITGNVTRGGTTAKLVFRRIGAARTHGAPSSNSWVSREQFECAMTMSRR